MVEEPLFGLDCDIAGFASLGVAKKVIHFFLRRERPEMIGIKLKGKTGLEEEIFSHGF